MPHGGFWSPRGQSLAAFGGYLRAVPACQKEAADAQKRHPGFHAFRRLIQSQRGSLKWRQHWLIVTTDSIAQREE